MARRPRRCPKTFSFVESKSSCARAVRIPDRSIVPVKECSTEVTNRHIGMNTEASAETGNEGSLESMRKDLLEQRQIYEVQLARKDVQIRLKEKLVKESHRKFVQVSAQNDTLKDLIQELKAQVARYKTLYVASTATQFSKVDQMHQNIQELQEKLEASSAIGNRDLSTVDTVEKEELIAKVAALEAQLTEKSRNEHLVTDLKATNEYLQRELDHQKESSEQRIQQLEQDMKDVQIAQEERIECAQQEIKRLKSEYKRQQEELQESCTRFQEMSELLEEKEEELNDSLLTTEADIPALRRDLKTTEELANERASRIAELEQWLEEALGELEHKERQFEEREGNLNNHLERIEKQTNELTSQLDSKQNEIKELQIRLADKERELAYQEENTVHRDRFAHLQHELDLTKKCYSDIKEELRSLKGDAYTSPQSSPSKGALVTPSSSGSPKGLRDVDDNAMKLLRTQLVQKEEECMELKKQLLQSQSRMTTLQLQIEEMEHEQAFSRAKLSELSRMLTSRKDSEQQLYDKSVECAELSTKLQTFQQKLRKAEGKVKMLEQENKLTKELVDKLNRSWDESSPGSGPDLQLIKREHDDSLARATELSIQLAEAQMQIDAINDDNKRLTKRNTTYAKQLSTMSNNNSQQHGFFGRLMETVESSKQEKELAASVQKLKQRIAILENENAAYMASLSAIKMDIQSTP